MRLIVSYRGFPLYNHNKYIANILKVKVKFMLKIKITTPSILPRFPTTSEKQLDLVNPVLTNTWHTFNSQFYQQTDDVAMRARASLTTAKIYIDAHERTATSTVLDPSKV